MTILETARAYKAISGLLDLKNLSGKTVLQLVRLSEKLKAAEDVLINRQDAVIQQYADKDASGQPVLDGGMVKVTDGVREITAKRALDALYGTEYDWEPREKISVRLPESQVPISAKDVQTLMPFIDFGGLGDGD